MRTTVKLLPKWLVFLPAIFYLFQLFISKPQVLKRSDYQTPPDIIKYLSMGFKPQLADSFWLRAMQDFDFCEQKINETACIGQSWLYRIVNITVDLDNEFLEAYFYGGIALTVLITDIEGATQIFDKGVSKFPKEWALNYVAGYHSMIEEKNKVKAAQRFLAAAENGAPSWVRLMAGRLAAEGGEEDFAEKVLTQLIELNEDPRWIKKLQEKLDQTKKRQINK